MWSKAAGRYTVVPLKECKPYAYIHQLQSIILNKRFADVHPMNRPIERSADDPRRLSRTLAPIAPPATALLVEQHKSRFSSLADSSLQ